MTTLIAWNNDPKLKAKVLDSIKQKIGNGQLLHGTYGEEHNGKMMGCAVFVTTCNTERPHEIFEEKYGIPMVLARYEDTIFEHLKYPRDEQWPVKFAKAIKHGADLSRVNAKFQVWLMQENLKHEPLWRKHDKKNEYVGAVVAALKQVLGILEKWAKTGVLDESAAKAAARSAAKAAARSVAKAAAWSAAESAEAAARSAAWSAAESAEAAARSVARSVARSAAWSAESAAWSARSAAWSARSAAWSARSAARDDFYIRASEKLLELLAEAPIAKEGDN